MSTPILVHLWGKYRLLRENAYGGTVHVIERDDKDSLGGPKWVKCYEWKSNRCELHADEALSALVDLVKPLLSQVQDYNTAKTTIAPLVDGEGWTKNFRIGECVQKTIERLTAERDAALAQVPTTSISTEVVNWDRGSL